MALRYRKACKHKFLNHETLFDFVCEDVDMYMDISVFSSAIYEKVRTCS